MSKHTLFDAAPIVKAEVRQVPGFPNYFASSDGKIYSNFSRRLMRELKPARGGGRNRDYGYITISNGVQTRLGVHQIVAMTFLEFPAAIEGLKYVVRHKDGNPLNNAASNLEWGTQSQNLLDRRRHGTAPVAAANHQTKLTIEQIAEIRRRRIARETCQSIARDFPVSRSQIHRIGLGQRWEHSDAECALRQRRRRATA